MFSYMVRGPDVPPPSKCIFTGLSHCDNWVLSNLDILTKISTLLLLSFAANEFLSLGAIVCLKMSLLAPSRQNECYSAHCMK